MDIGCYDLQITISRLAESCGISTRAIQKNIELLKNEGAFVAGWGGSRWPLRNPQWLEKRVVNLPSSARKND